MPRMQQLAASGVQSFQTDITEAQNQRQSEDPSGSLGVPINHQERKCQPLVGISTGLPALQKKLVDRIRANKYIDFAELPPAKGKGRPLPQSLEGQIIVVQAADLMHTRKIIPDLATWC